jgi:hypothetical protein
LGFKESKWSLGVGAYGGARTGIYVKTKEETGAKEHFKSAYNLNKFHYGFAAELGRKGFAIFARYEATPLFKDNNPNQLQCDYIRNSFVKSLKPKVPHLIFVVNKCGTLYFLLIEN